MKLSFQEYVPETETIKGARDGVMWELAVTGLLRRNRGVAVHTENPYSLLRCAVQAWGYGVGFRFVTTLITHGFALIDYEHGYSTQLYALDLPEGVDIELAALKAHPNFSTIRIPV
jgi:hypothetical protein